MSKKESGFFRDAGLGAIIGATVGATYNLGKKAVKTIKKLFRKDEEVIDDDPKIDEGELNDQEEADTQTDEE